MPHRFSLCHHTLTIEEAEKIFLDTNGLTYPENTSLYTPIQRKTGACTTKNYGFVNYVLRSKLVRLFKQMKVTDKRKTLAYYEIYKLRMQNALYYRP